MKTSAKEKKCRLRKREIREAINWVLMGTKKGTKFPTDFGLIGIKNGEEIIQLQVQKRGGFFFFFYDEPASCELGFLMF